MIKKLNHKEMKEIIPAHVVLQCSYVLVYSSYILATIKTKLLQ